MFRAPAEIETRVLARVPEALRLDGEASWMSRRGRVGSFLEGPAFDTAGNLYLVDLAHGRILRLPPGGEMEVVVKYDGGPNGLAIHADGGVYIADRLKGILRLDPVSGVVEPVLTELPGARLHGPNDLTFASNGDLYFTDQGETGLHDPTGRLVRLSAAGEVDVILDNVPSPNGLVLDRDERAVLLAVTRGNCIWHVPLNRDRVSVGRVGLFIQLSGGPGGGPDGLALDAEGNLVIAHARFGSVWIFSELGEPLYRLRSCAGRLTTNAAFGGPDGKTLYITESETGAVLTAALPTAGQRLYSHEPAGASA